MPQNQAQRRPILYKIVKSDGKEIPSSDLKILQDMKKGKSYYDSIMSSAHEQKNPARTVAHILNEVTKFPLEPQELSKLILHAYQTDQKTFLKLMQKERYLVLAGSEMANDFAQQLTTRKESIHSLTINYGDASFSPLQVFNQLALRGIPVEKLIISGKRTKQQEHELMLFLNTMPQIGTLVVDGQAGPFRRNPEAEIKAEQATKDATKKLLGFAIEQLNVYVANRIEGILPQTTLTKERFQIMADLLGNIAKTPTTIEQLLKKIDDTYALARLNRAARGMANPAGLEKTLDTILTTIAINLPQYKSVCEGIMQRSIPVEEKSVAKEEMQKKS